MVAAGGPLKNEEGKKLSVPIRKGKKKYSATRLSSFLRETLLGPRLGRGNLLGKEKALQMGGSQRVPRLEKKCGNKGLGSYPDRAEKGKEEGGRKSTLFRAPTGNRTIKGIQADEGRLGLYLDRPKGSSSRKEQHDIGSRNHIEFPKSMLNRRGGTSEKRSKLGRIEGGLGKLGGKKRTRKGLTGA